jgi:hypothetical protein
MKKINALLFLITFLFISSCNPSEKKQEKAGWRKLECGLYTSPDGEIGFPSDAEVAHDPSLTIGNERCKNAFITHFGAEQKQSLRSVVDTNTFVSLGANFYKDKSNIYTHYEICEGGYLHIFSNDTASFRVLGNCYAVHKSQIYHHRKGWMDADAASFKTSLELGQLAKDKDGFFSFGERIGEEQLGAEAGEKILRQLKDL